MDELVDRVATRLRELRKAAIGFESEAEGYGVYFYDPRTDEEILKVTGFRTVSDAGDAIATETAKAVLEVVSQHEREEYAHEQAMKRGEGDG
jgi:hypothetical protein